VTVAARNAARCGSLGGIRLFLRLLQTELEPSAAVQVVLTLAHCTDDCRKAAVVYMITMCMTLYSAGIHLWCDARDV